MKRDLEDREAQREFKRVDFEELKRQALINDGIAERRVRMVEERDRSNAERKLQFEENEQEMKLKEKRLLLEEKELVLVERRAALRLEELEIAEMERLGR
jgi:hypothetical protein